MKHLKRFIKDNKAVLGLPMRLTVSLIIGTVALAAILTYILNPCLFPSQMTVSASPMINTITGNQPTELNITVFVKNPEGKPIKDASVIIKGLDGIGSNFTDINGETEVKITVILADSANEGYLDVNVKAACHQTYIQEDLIKIIKQ